MSGQHLHRTAVAFAEIRRGVLAGLPTGAGGSGGYQPLLSVLQLRTTAPKPGVPNAGGSLPGPGCAAMTESIRKKGFVECGGPPPKPSRYLSFARKCLFFWRQHIIMCCM